MTGIYKITSPTKRVYIGQAIDWDRRLKEYKSSLGKRQTKIHNSLLKYGFENHKFEFIHECFQSELNEMERYYQDLYSAIGKGGLNCKLTATNTQKYRHSEETKNRISESSKGRKLSKEHIKIISKTHLGKIVSQETRKKQSLLKKGIPLTKEHIKKISDFQRGKKHTEETKIKMRKNSAKYWLGREITDSHRLNLSLNSPNNKPVLDTKTNIIYISVSEAAKILGFNKGTLNAYLSGKRKNKTSLVYA